MIWFEKQVFRSIYPYSGPPTYILIGFIIKQVKDHSFDVLIAMLKSFNKLLLTFANTVEPRFSERQPSGKPRYSGNFADDQLFI